MAAFKDKKNGTWYVQFRYTDWTGERQQKLKRGFTTKREAQEWEREFLRTKRADPDMSFESFVKLYEQDIKPKIRLNTWLTKESVIESKILPYFKKRKLSEITPRDVLTWQNQMLKQKDKAGQPYSPTYLKNINNQLSAIFNHAVRFYGLHENPVRRAGAIGEKESEEMLFWTKEEFLQFITPADFNFKEKTLRINKSYQRIKGEDVITPPKTKKSIRTITIPDFLCDEIQDYFKQFYSLPEDARVFPLSKHQLTRGMEYGCKQSGVKKIRIHDLRHSHVSLLINMGYSAVAIGNRVGHESVDITFRYAHMFPTVQKEMATKLNEERSA